MYIRRTFFRVKELLNRCRLGGIAKDVWEKLVAGRQTYPLRSHLPGILVSRSGLVAVQNNISNGTSYPLDFHYLVHEDVSELLDTIG